MLVCFIWVQLFEPYGLSSTRLLCPWDSPGKNTGVGCHALLQRSVPIEGSNPCLLHWQVCSLPLAPPENPTESHRTHLILPAMTYDVKC